jgi:hypothetical protein
LLFASADRRWLRVAAPMDSGVSGASCDGRACRRHVWHRQLVNCARRGRMQ